MKLTGLILTMLFGIPAFAGFQGFNNNTTNLGLFEGIKCSTGLTCSKLGANMVVSAGSGTALALSGNLSVGGVSTLTGGVAQSAITPSGALMTNFQGYVSPWLTTASGAVQVTGVSGSVYMSQVYIPVNVTLTGIEVLNGATVGTNRWWVAIYNSLGVPVASAIASGALTTGTNSYQAVPFTASGVITGPGIYWIGATLNGSTDTFTAIPTQGTGKGKAGAVTGQSYGVPATLVPPTTFTANSVPVMFTY